MASRMRHFLLAGTTALVSLAPAHSSALELRRSTVDGGGAESSASGFVLRGTAGQPDAGIMEHQSSGFVLRGGYWHGGQNLTGVEGVEPQTPRWSFRLYPARPNPSNPATTIAFDQPEEGRASLVIYNARGERVRTLLAKTMPAGHHELIWRGRDDGGSSVASGVYFLTLDLPGRSARQKITLVR